MSSRSSSSAQGHKLLAISPHKATFLKLLSRSEVDFRTYLKVAILAEGETIAKHQEPWIDACQDIGDHPLDAQKYFFVAPPGAGKSTVIGVGFTSWIIGKNPNRHFGYISYADQVARERAIPIRNLIEFSSIYHKIFPNVTPDKAAWGSSSFRVLRENLADLHPTLRAGGAMSAIVAYRLDGTVIDDPMSQKNSATPDFREKTCTNYQNAIMTRLIDTAWQLGIGTRWAEDDFIGYVLKKGGWKVHVTKALTATGKSYWPEHYPLLGPNKATGFEGSKLWYVREHHPDLWAMQYMSDTTGANIGIIRNLRTYTELPPDILARERDLVIGFGIDTALKDRQQNDYHVIYVGGLDRYGRVWMLDRVKVRCGMPELLDNIVTLYHKWTVERHGSKFPPFAIWVEDTASGTPAVQMLAAQLPYFPTILVPVQQGGKRSRANAISPFLHGGHVLWPKMAEWYDDAAYELLHFPYTAHDDDVDALYVLLDNLLKITHPSSYDDPRPRGTLRIIR